MGHRSWCWEAEQRYDNLTWLEVRDPEETRAGWQTFILRIGP